MAGSVRESVDGSIGWIVFDHPERRNALTPDMWIGIGNAARRFGADERVRVVVMRGAGDEAFISGADISQFDHSNGVETSQGIERTTGEAFAALAALDVPLVAAIHGPCVGGGLAIALSADLRYAADDAVFGIPAARLGVAYPITGIEQLVRVVGPADAAEILFTARRYPADEALAMGLVNRVLPKAKLDDHVLELAEEIAANAPLTIRSIRLALRELRREPSQRDLAGLREAAAACFRSDDYSEGVAAFLEKRSPRFRGR
jgi:enoyl-CoA hydratase/carnithine racemase